MIHAKLFSDRELLSLIDFICIGCSKLHWMSMDNHCANDKTTKFRKLQQFSVRIFKPSGVGNYFFLFAHIPNSYTQTHHAQCLAQDERFLGIDCELFDHPAPMTMALSVLVVIEMLNSLNR